jgi:hypothetical protein
MDLDTPQQPNSRNSETIKTPAVAMQSRAPHQDSFLVIKRITAWIMIISATLFALVGVLAVWEVFGANAGDVVWRAFVSLAIITFASLVVNVASRIATHK